MRQYQISNVMAALRGGAICFLLVVGIITAGCADSTKTTAKDETAMRDALQSKDKFDINKVPPEARSKVQAMMGKPASEPKQSTAPGK